MPQLENPKGAFGYPTTGTQVRGQSQYHSPEIHVFRNASTARGIPFGAAVVLAGSTADAWGSTAAGVLTATTVDDSVFISTVIGHPGVIGIALTTAAARSTGTTFGVGPAPSSEYCQVMTKGTFYGGVVSSGATGNAPGRHVINSNDTAVEGGTMHGGVMTLFDAANATTAAGINGLVGLVGFTLTSGTTGTTGYLTTVLNRATIWVNPSVTYRTTVTT